MKKLKTPKNKYIIKNAAKCFICGDIVVSTKQDEFITCTCGNVGVSGGHKTIERQVLLDHRYQELSEFKEEGIPYV